MSWEVITGDCLEVMPTLEANSVDTIITDPPYGLSFMGKDWDHGVPGEHFWREALRVAKPGAMLLAFGGARTFHRLTVAIEDAGWEIRDVLMWVYASGFPKSHDISKAIDREAGAEREVVSLNRYAGRRKEGSGPLNGDTCYGQFGIPGGETQPSTDAARTWHGYGTALKPAWEPIIVAMKPLDGTFAQNAQAHGVAGLWIDGCRVGTETVGWSGKGRSGSSATAGASRGGHQGGYNYADGLPRPMFGRWPANLIHDGSDEVVGLFPVTTSHQSMRGERSGNIDGNGAGQSGPNTMRGHNDTGSAARFFYCAKASKADRDEGLSDWPLVPAGGMEGRNDGSMGSITLSRNHHPTVKPIALMRYLARLTKTPTGGVVLDPFAGSGSTGIGAVLEGRSFIGIEREEEYAEIARRRIEHWAAQVVQPALLETE